MSAKKAKEMEKSPWRKPSKGTDKKEIHDRHTTWLPSKEPTQANVENPEWPQFQVPKTLVHPPTPVPWSKWRVKRMQQAPAGDEKESLFSTSANMCEEAKASTAASMAGGSGDHRTWPTESNTQVKKEAAELHLNPASNRLEAADVLETFLGQLLTYLHECPDRPYFSNMEEPALGSRYSQYEYEKILHPGEFEVMLSISLPECIQYTEVEGYNGLFYTLNFLKKSRSFPAALLLEDGRTISPRNVMEEFWKHVDQFVKTFYSVPLPGWQVKLEKKKPNCPAVGLLMLDPQGVKFMSVSLIPALEMAGQWPCLKKAKDILEEREMLPLMRVFYFVAKQSPGRLNKETWRISFSHIEKEILNRHSSSQACRKYHKEDCCRRECLKMLEDLVAALKAEYPQMLAHLSCYHARTSFLHSLWESKADTDWQPGEMASCFERVLSNFLHEVATAQLPHFFLPKCNLFGAKFFPPTKLKFLWSHLKEKEGTAKTFTVSRKRSYPTPLLGPDMTWPLMVTLGLIGLFSLVLPHMTT
ncbi:cyclic GMP-AMP synthase-like [Anolis carolinensis]|uniref:cyclic GMP-AMP synthase-like n=1 Tax=Anolis carolinensis TaxID=28377 RepID=UPI002F2B7EC1